MGEVLRQSDNGIQKGLRVYRIKGVDRDIIARKGGPTKQQIKESSTYEVLRKNQNEFGAASRLAKSIRSSFSPDIAKLCGPYVSGKLTAAVRNTIKKSEGEKGKRPIMLSRNQSDFLNFDFDTGKTFDSVFKAKYHLKSGSTYGHFIFHCSTFVPSESIEYPESATHFRLFTHVVSLSDMAYDTSREEYGYLSESNGCSSVESSELLPITKLDLEPFYFSISVNELCSDQKENLTLAVLMGIQFYRFKNGRYEDCREGNALSIVKMI